MKTGESGSTVMPEADVVRGSAKWRASRVFESARWVAEHPAWAIIPLGMALVAAAGLYRLGSKSLWLDEAFALALARHSWAGVWSISWGPQVAGNMLLYQLLQHPWLALGSSEAAFRSLSVVFAVATVPPFYLLTRRLFGSGAAAASILLLALNAFFVQYAQEARAYSLVLFLVVVSSTLLLRAIDRPTSGRWLAYVLSAVLALYSHYFAALIILAHFVSLLARRPAVPKRVMVVVFGSIAVAAVPLLVAAKAQGMQIGWVPHLTVDYARNVLVTLIGSTGDHLQLLLPAAYVAVCAGGIAVALVRRQWRWEWLFAASLVLVPIGVALVVSLATPVFVARYLIVALPGLVLLAVAAFSLVRPRWLAIAGVLALAVLSANNLRGWYTGMPKEDWRDAVQYVAVHAQPGDAMIVYPNYCRLPVDYYMLQHQSAATTIQPLFPTPGWGQYFPGEVDGATLQVALTSQKTPAKRIWIVYRYGPPSPSSPDGMAIAAATHNQPPLSDTHFPYVGVQLYQIGP
jgi:mannosyltransferase